MAIHSSILAWRIPWTEGLVGCSPWGLKEMDTTEQQSTAQQIYIFYQVEEFHSISSFLRLFYCEWVLDFVKYFLCTY